MKHNYSIAERNRIVEENLPTIDKVIRRNWSLMRAAHMEYDDVYQDLAVQLIRCVDNFDPEKGSPKAHIYSQLRYELLNCKEVRRLTGFVGAPAGFRKHDILPLKGAVCYNCAAV